jgi:translation initiation factor 2 beta subunit (eIF-2beta)/eIF-5
MSHILLNNSNLNQIQKKIENGQANLLPLPNMDYVKSFTIVHQQSTQLTYHNLKTDAQFSITVRMSTVNCILANGQEFDCVTMFGLSVGDIIKHYINIHNPTDIAKFLTDDADVSEIQSLIDEMLTKDSSNGANKNILGTYLHHNGQVNVWHNLMDRDIINSSRRDNWSNYCQSIVYLSKDDMSHLINTKTGHIKKCETFTLFNKISSHKIVERLLRYFFCDEDSSVDNYYQYHYVFDRPVNLVEILQHQEEGYGDDVLSDYEWIISELNKKLNKRQTLLLESKYPTTTFKSIDCVPESFPFYAYRNIWLYEWHGNERNQLVSAYCTYMRHEQHDKIKFSMSKQDSTSLPYGEYDPYLFHGCHNKKCIKENRQNKKDKKKSTRRACIKMIRDSV